MLCSIPDFVSKGFLLTPNSFKIMYAIDEWTSSFGSRPSLPPETITNAATKTFQFNDLAYDFSLLMKIVKRAKDVEISLFCMDIFILVL